MTELDRITVAGVTVDIVKESGLIPLRPVVESLGLDWSGVNQRLKRHEWSVVGMTPTTGSDGKTYEMTAVDGPTFIMWLATVQASRVSERVRPTVVAFQKEAAQALFNYFTKGYAINPRFEYASEATEANEGYTLAQAARHLGVGLQSFTRTLRETGILGRLSTGHHFPCTEFDRWFSVASTNGLRVTEEGMAALKELSYT